jgi:hypothetical protein
MSKFIKISQQVEPEVDKSQDQQIMQTMMSYAPKMTADSFMKGIYDISKMPSSNPQAVQAKEAAFRNFFQTARADVNNFANYLTKLGIKI